jgi:hypothetical protein
VASCGRDYSQQHSSPDLKWSGPHRDNRRLMLEQACHPVAHGQHHRHLLNARSMSSRWRGQCPPAPRPLQWASSLPPCQHTLYRQLGHVAAYTLVSLPNFHRDHEQPGHLRKPQSHQRIRPRNTSRLPLARLFRLAMWPLPLQRPQHLTSPRLRPPVPAVRPGLQPRFGKLRGQRQRSYRRDDRGHLRCRWFRIYVNS